MREENLTEKERLLYKLCCRSCMLDMSGYDYISTTGSLAWQLCISKYKVRKYLKEYEQEGLVRRVCEGGCADDELRVWCIKGWVITPKVRYMNIYKWANWRASKIMWEIWAIVPSQYYATNTAEWYRTIELKNYIDKFVRIEIKGIPSVCGIFKYNYNTKKFRCMRNHQWCTIQRVSDITAIEEVHYDELSIYDKQWIEKRKEYKQWGSIK